MKILVLNSGSSTIKFQLFNMENETVLARGTAGRIGINNSYLKYKNYTGFENKFKVSIPDHKTGIKLIMDMLLDKRNGVLKSIKEVSAAGHRIAHGGSEFSDSTLIDREVIKKIEDVSELAPLHNPHNLTGIKICSELLPDIPQVAVFDTAFNQTIPKKAYIYGLPYRYYEKYGIRRYGFHGTSHKYVAGRAAKLLGNDLAQLKIITCHLGNGASITAVDGGKSVDNSMGFTPLEGLVMGTRCGDIDPAIISFLAEKEDITVDKINDILNGESGLLGISGISSDFVALNQAADDGDKRARLALDVFGYRVKKYIGAYMAVMSGLDAIVFTGGIGENNPGIRESIVNNMEFFGIELDSKENKVRGEEAVISTGDSQVKVLVVPTDEELVIARDTERLVEENL